MKHKILTAILLNILTLLNTSCQKKKDDTNIQNLAFLLFYQRLTEDNAQSAFLSTYPSCNSPLTASTTSQSISKATTSSGALQAAIVFTVTGNESFIMTGTNLVDCDASTSLSHSCPIYSGNACTTYSVSSSSNTGYTYTLNSDSTQLTISGIPVGTYTMFYTVRTSLASVPSNESAYLQ
ncbi:MAG: hypothetical protein AAF518_22755 [Spirochaetota bacterium]